MADTKRNFTKEEKEKVKFIKKEFNKQFHVIGKKYKWKFRDWALWKVVKDFFFTGDYRINDIVLISENYIKLNITLQVKPYIIDEVFWEIFELEENKKMPIGLRANGAFVMKGPFLIFENKDFKGIEPTEGNFSEIIIETIKTMNSSIEQFLNDEWRLDNFIEFINKNMDDRGDKKIMEMLLLIIKKEYKNAYEIVRDEINENRSSRYGNYKGDAYEYIKKYCKDRI